MKHLGLLALAIIAVFAVFRYIDETTKQDFDTYIVGMIGVAYLMLGLTMVAFTRKWSIRALGLLSTICGGAVFWLATLMVHLRPDSVAWVGTAEDVLRALIVVGVVLLGIGFWSYYFGPHDGGNDVTGD